MRNYIQITDSGGTRKVEVLVSSLDAVDISSWVHTAVVGGMISQIEALDQGSQIAVKMATVFVNNFTVRDMIVASHGIYGSTVLADGTLILLVLKGLVRAGFLEEVDH